MKNKQLLFSITKKDLIVDWFSGSGGGGQHRNKHNNCCRIRHPESGAMATGQEQKSRKANLSAALHRLVKRPRFLIWHAKKCWEVENQMTIESLVEEQLRPENLKIEGRGKDGWEDID